ncbi:hypothetical protein [Sodalis sp. RH22]
MAEVTRARAEVWRGMEGKMGEIEGKDLQPQGSQGQTIKRRDKKIYGKQ